MRELFYELRNLFLIGLFYLVLIRKIQIGKEGLGYNIYNNLTDQEKELYDRSKIKRLQVMLFLILFLLYLVGLFIRIIFPQYQLFVNVTIVFLILFLGLGVTQTKFFLKLFCKKRNC